MTLSHKLTLLLILHLIEFIHLIDSTVLINENSFFFALRL